MVQLLGEAARWVLDVACVVTRIQPEREALEVAAAELEAVAEIHRMYSRGMSEPLASKARSDAERCVRVAAWLRSLRG
jgi:hypothetical protein